jgi:hypothetical protein
VQILVTRIAYALEVFKRFVKDALISEVMNRVNVAYATALAQASCTNFDQVPQKLPFCAEKITLILATDLRRFSLA